MPPLRLLTPLVSAAAALSLAIVGGLAPDAGAAPKAAAPPLKITAKVCSIGQTAEERFVRFDVAAGPGDGDVRPAFRVRLQSRATAKERWGKVATTPTETEVDGWEIATKPNAIVAATKSLGTLQEGWQHRVLVDARGYNAAGKPSTKMTTRTVTCTQPLFTPTLRLAKVTGAASADGYTVATSIRNAGRLPSGEGTVTVFDANTRETLGTAAVKALRGGARVDVDVAIPSCPGQVYVKVQPLGADPSELQPQQYTTIDCKATRSRTRQR